MRVIKIAIYTKDPNGGIGRFLEYFIPFLQANTQFKILTLSHISPINTKLPINTIGISTKKFNTFHLLSIGIALKNILYLHSELKKFRPDIVISIDLYANILIALLNFNKNYCHIMSTHINLAAHIKYGRSRLIQSILKVTIKTIYKKAQHHIVPSKELQRQMIKDFAISRNIISFIPNPINIDFIKKLSQKEIKNDSIGKSLRQKNIFNIFSVGRFEEQKNFEVLLKVFKILKNKYPHLQLFLLGSGKLLKKYKRIVTDLKINDVFFLGWQKNPYQYLKYAHLFVFISKYEGLPYSILEAQVLNLPIVASDIDYGPRELLGYGDYGILIKNDSVDYITNKISNIIANPKKMHLLKNMSIKASHNYMKNTSNEDYVTLILKIYSQYSKSK